MGLIANILSFTRVTKRGASISEVKIDPGGGANVTGDHFAAAGDDAHPLTTDYAFVSQGPQSGSAVAVGYVDPINTAVAAAGDKRIYGRDASTGAYIVDLWLHNDGTARITNATAVFEVKLDGTIKGDNGSGSFELAANGDFLVNGVTIDTGGNVTTTATVMAGTLNGTTSVLAAAKELVLHTHPAGTVPGNTGVNN